MYTTAHEAEVAASIVVGIDGSELSARALSWACDEAGRTGRTLHLVHAIALDMPCGGADVCAAPTDPDLARAEGDAGRLVEEALEICRSEASDVHVTWCVPVGLPKTILVEHSRTAHLVVVGARGGGCVLRALPGSVSSQVASSADCPVVVVQQFEG